MKTLTTHFLFVIFIFASLSVLADNKNVQQVKSTEANQSSKQVTADDPSILVHYPFISDENYTVLSPDLASSDLDFSNLEDYYISNDGFGVVLQSYPACGADNYANAVTEDSYFTLTLTGNDIFDADSLLFEVGKGGSADPRGYFVRSSIDNYVTDIISETLPSGNQQAPVLKKIKLGEDFEGISSVTFRFYVFTPSCTSYSVDFRNLVVKKPEPPADIPISLYWIIVFVGLISVYYIIKLK